HRLATVLAHQLEVAALVAVAAIAVRLARAHAVAGLRRARHAAVIEVAQLVERAARLLVARPVRERAAEEADACGLLGARRVVAAHDRAVALALRRIAN